MSTDNTKLMQIRTLVKSRLKQMGMTYTDLARELGVSVATVKRWLTTGEFSVDAMDKMLEIVRMSWKDLAQSFDEPMRSTSKLEPEEEAFFANHSRATFIVILLSAGLSCNDILKRFNIPSKELTQILISLDRASIVKFESLDRVRLRIPPPFKFNTHGPFSKKYFALTVRTLVNGLIFDKNSFGNDYDPNKPYVNLGESYLTKKSIQEFKLQLKKLVDQIRETSRIEVLVEDNEDLFPVSFIFGFDQFQLWKTVLWDKPSKLSPIDLSP